MPLSGRRKRERKSNKLKKRRAGRNSCSAFAWGTEEYFRPRCGIDSPTTARIGACRPMDLSPASVPEGFQRASGKPFGAPAGAAPFPNEGWTSRPRRGSRTCRPIGFSPTSVPEGLQRASGKPFGAPTGAAPFPNEGWTSRLRRGSRACSPMVFSPASVPEGFQRASGKPFGAPAGAYPCPGRGMARRLRRGRWACSSIGSHQLRCPKVCKGRAESPLVRPQAHILAPGGE